MNSTDQRAGSSANGSTDVMLRVRGVVQGVGFRPFVHRAACRLGLRGWVKNDLHGVLIRASGPQSAVAALARALLDECPPAARVQSVEARPAAAEHPLGPDGFSILPSDPGSSAAETCVPPDLALCPDCRGELSDPSNRRFGYPFINCTQCGPRYSIVERLPYDRERTTMRAFTLCPRCQAEYRDPADRRFHAEPNACPVCGPRAVLWRGRGQETEGPGVFAAAAELLGSGGILAVKGVGGYHLMVDAGSEQAVAELRRRKQREEKPLAAMFPSLESVRAAAEVTSAAEALLRSAEAPIVLLRRRPGARIASAVAPDNPWLGVLLPYSPLHALLLGAFGRPVVATSGNLSEEPLCFHEEEAHGRLAAIADAWLDHNRGIAHPVDDSVVRLSARGPVFLRRARGYAPLSLRLPRREEGSSLCVGAQMKSTLAAALGDRVVVSPHIGDLEGAATRKVFRKTARILEEISGTAFTRVVCDKHPDYASTRYAAETGLPLTSVQHHLAHVLACLLDHGAPAEGVLGVAFDGTGYGEDGTIWGGEFLLLGGGKAVRFARLRPFPLLGGEAAVRDGRRSALGMAHAAGTPDFEATARSLGFCEAEATLFRLMLERGLNSPLCSSAGRLFDAVGAILGIAGRNSFEGQTPLAVEAAAAASSSTDSCPFPLRRVPSGEGARLEIDWEAALTALWGVRHRRGSPADAAAAFHRGLARAIASVAREAGAGTVALGGGCFQNLLLLDRTVEALEDAGLTVLAPRELPPNDGAISAGQALAAHLALTSVNPP